MAARITGNGHPEKRRSEREFQGQCSCSEPVSWMPSLDDPGAEGVKNSLFIRGGAVDRRQRFQLLEDAFKGVSPAENPGAILGISHGRFEKKHHSFLLRLDVLAHPIGDLPPMGVDLPF